MENEYNELEHKELRKKIYKCKCSPIKDGDYCNECKSAVLDFMKQYGAGVLCRDRQLEVLNAELKSALCLNDNLNVKLDTKTKKVEDLKVKLRAALENHEVPDGM